MRRLLVPLLAGVAVLSLGVMLAFADQPDPDESGEPPSPVALPPVAPAPFGAITGEVVRGPTCGGPVIEGQACEEPSQATIDIRNQAGQLVAHFQSDPTGHFFVPLPPGVYTVDATRPQVAQPARDFEIPQVSPQQLTITSGVVEQVHVRIDTGIR